MTCVSFFFFSFPQHSKAHVYSGMWQKIQSFEESHGFVLSPSHSEHVSHMYSSKYAYICDVTAIWVEQAKNCGVEIMKERFLMAPYSIGLQNNSAYKDVISNM